MRIPTGAQGAEELRHSAYLGMGIDVACSALVLATVWFLPATNRDVGITLAIASFSLVASLVLYRLPWERWPARALLAFPGLGLASLALIAMLTSGISPAYTGFFTVAIYFIALTQSQRTTFLAIALAVPLWMIGQGGLSATVAVKLPITVGIWLLIGLTLSQRRASAAAHIRGLVRAAATDPLTGLASRSELAGVLDGASTGDVFVIVDLDGFKAANDERGHLAGDRILADFGAAVRDVLRGSDAAVRYGGDEFLFVLGQTGPAGAESTLHRLRARWDAPDRPTFSAGIAAHTGDRPAETLRMADEALYRAKAAGRNRWQTQDTGDPVDPGDLRDVG